MGSGPRGGLPAGFEPGDDPSDRTLRPLRRHLAEERQAHRELELMVEVTDVEWTHVRPGLLAANALGWAQRIRAERVVREQYGTAGYPVARSRRRRGGGRGAADRLPRRRCLHDHRPGEGLAGRAGEGNRRGGGRDPLRGADTGTGSRAVAPRRLPGFPPTDRHPTVDHRTATAHLRAVGPRPCVRVPSARAYGEAVCQRVTW